jgi:hypothetical protein
MAICQYHKCGKEFTPTIKGQRFCPGDHCRIACHNDERLHGIHFSEPENALMLEFARPLGKSIKEMLWMLFKDASGNRTLEGDSIPLKDDQVWGVEKETK